MDATQESVDRHGCSPLSMANRTHLLLAELGEREMALPEEVARQVISDRLDEVAARMGVGRRPARNYVTDDVIADSAAEF
jgi:hypothetical protein